jgi:hypothetical protein
MLSVSVRWHRPGNRGKSCRPCQCGAGVIQGTLTASTWVNGSSSLPVSSGGTGADLSSGCALVRVGELWTRAIEVEP